jgi:hypothetical protein
MFHFFLKISQNVPFFSQNLHVAKERANTKVKGGMPKKMKFSQNFSKCSIFFSKCHFFLKMFHLFPKCSPLFSQILPIVFSNSSIVFSNSSIFSQILQFFLKMFQLFLKTFSFQINTKKNSKYPGLIQKGGDCCERQKIEFFFCQILNKINPDLSRLHS